MYVFWLPDKSPDTKDIADAGLMLQEIGDASLKASGVRLTLFAPTGDIALELNQRQRALLEQTEPGSQIVTTEFHQRFAPKIGLRQAGARARAARRVLPESIGKESTRFSLEFLTFQQIQGTNCERASCRPAYVPSLRVLHNEQRSLAEVFREAWRKGDARVRLARAPSRAARVDSMVA